ncbi:MAG TPA: TolC family protein [Vicinamibacterales bacterium]|nr:TolC family protein [Vicinamibacterales bacterium]
MSMRASRPIPIICVALIAVGSAGSAAADPPLLLRVPPAIALAVSAQPAQQPAAAGQTPAPVPAPAGPRLTLRDARDRSLKNHPRVMAAQNEFYARQQIQREVRSAYFPTFGGAVTGAQGNDNARIGAGGGLSASRLFDRVGEGVVLSQLITDLGRTNNLVASSKFDAQASEQNYQATREDALLAVDHAYYGTLRAQAVVRVAQDTVAARQLLYDQVNTLAQNGLRSNLDVSFADVNLSDAKLLLIRSQNDLQASYAQLARALGTDRAEPYQLMDEPLPSSPSPNVEDLVNTAMNSRPDIAKLRLERESAQKFSYAERDLNRPVVSAVGVAGLMSYSSLQPVPDKYEGVAVNVDVPVFNGGLFSARHATAEYRAMEADNVLRDLQEAVAQDVRMAWANVTTAYQRLDVTAQFLRSATLALDLAQGRYNLGLSSIVELTQAQLNVTRAEIEDLGAKYDFQDETSTLQYAIGLLR